VNEIRATGGGARSAVWRGILADVLGRPIRRTAVEEGPAFGAALLAGVTAGLYRDVAEATSAVRLVAEVDEPDPGRHAMDSELHTVYSQLYRETAAAMHRLGELSSIS
jgi:xylulokinase